MVFSMIYKPFFPGSVNFRALREFWIRKIWIFNVFINKTKITALTARNTSPAVSVILPFYNAGNTLADSLTSIRHHTFRDFECLLVNNNATDDSEQIAKELCGRDDRFVLLNGQKQGVMHAFNTGLAHARGRYIARADADDINMPDRLRLQYAFLERHPDYGLVASKAIYTPISDNTLGFARYVHWSNGIMTHRQIFLNRFVESPVINPTVMWRRGVCEKYGSYQDGPFPEDYELWLRWLEKGVKFHKLDEYLIAWHDHPGRLTRTDPRYEDRAFFYINPDYSCLRHE